MYTKKQFGIELKEKIQNSQYTEEIGYWAYSMYLENCVDLAPGLRKVMLDLQTMELGPQFALSYKRLNEIADDLIAEKVEINTSY